MFGVRPSGLLWSLAPREALTSVRHHRQQSHSSEPMEEPIALQ
jgi:hypothetical protein